MSAHPAPGIICSTAVPRRRVFVRDPKHRVGDFALGLLGTLTHENRLGTMVLNVCVQLDTGAELICPPGWLRPAFDLATLFSLPAA